MQYRVKVELWDNRDRLIAQTFSSGAPEMDSSGGQATVRVGNYTTNIGWVRVTLLGSGRQDHVIDRRQVQVNLGQQNRNFDAYELVYPGGGPPGYQPWTPTLDAQMRKMGLSVFSRPDRNFKMMAPLYLSTPKEPWFGAGWNQRRAYIEERDKFLQTHDTRYLIRHPDIADDAEMDKLRSEVDSSMKRFEGYRPIAYFLADESSLTSYGDPFDFSWSPATLTKFQVWLKTQYPSLQALNKEWESHFTSCDQVMPLYTSEAQAKGDYAGWVDHRTFMETMFSHAFQVAADELHKQGSGALASISGTQPPGPSNGINCYVLDHVLGYPRPYSNDDQNELNRSIRPGLLLTGFTGYSRHGEGLRWQLWHSSFHGQIDASVFWRYTAVNPDLTLSEQGHDFEETVNEFRHDGLALLLRGTDRDNRGIAVHYSLRSLRGEWVTDGHIRPHEVARPDGTSAHLSGFLADRQAWLQALEDGGYKYDFLTTEQIENGQLPKYRVLILPDPIVLTDAEVAAIRQFVQKGGLLIADAQTGLMDGHGRRQSSWRLDDLLGVHQQPGHTDPNETAAAKIHLSLNGAALDLSVLAAEPNLTTPDGCARAMVGSTPLLIEHRYGGGRAITLNFWMADYTGLRQPGVEEPTNDQDRMTWWQTGLRQTGMQEPRLHLLESYLLRAGVRPVVEVQGPNHKPIACSERIVFTRGDTRYLAVIPNPYGMEGFPNTGKAAESSCIDRTPIPITLSQRQYVYNLRTHQYMGHISRVSASPSAGSPIFLALESSPIGQLSVAAAGADETPLRVKAGTTAHFSIRLRDWKGQRAPDCPVDVQVQNATGKVMDYCRSDFLLKNGKGEFTLPLALNDVEGTWRITVRTPFTRRVTNTTFVVND